jgi:hypothetical protein
LPAETVPWITSVKPNFGDAATLIDISKTGVLIETTTRLLPGRRNTLVLSGPDNQPQRIDGKVVRTQLVRITPNDGPLYRTALTFTKGFELNLPGAPDATAHQDTGHDNAANALVAPDPSHPHLEGPFDALLVGDTGSDVVEVSNITETGCFVEIHTPVALDDVVSISVQFSDVHHIMLAGTIASIRPDRGCTLRFTNLTPEQRRALRVEIRASATSRRGKAAPAKSALHAVEPGVLLVESLNALPSYMKGRHANEW